MSLWRLAVVAVGALLVTPFSARATERTSSADDGSQQSGRRRPSPHAEIPLESDRIAMFLAELERSALQARLKELTQKFLKEALKDPAKAWHQSKEFQDELKKLMSRGEAARGVDPDLLRQLLDRYQQTPREAAHDSGDTSDNVLDPQRWRKTLESYTPEQQAEILKRLQKMVPEASRPQPTAPQRRPPRASPQAAPRPVPPSPRDDEPDAENVFEQWLLRQIRSIDTEHEFFQSPTIQDMLRELGQYTNMQDWDRVPRNGRFNALSKQLLDSVKRLNLDRLASRFHLRPVKHVNLAPPTGWRLPRLRLPSFTLTSPGLPSFGVPNGPSTPQRGLTTTVLAVLLAGLVWYLWARRRRRQVAPVPTALLVSWPVQPESVTTKEELILAFEYVSFLHLGLGARSKHHRDLADSLGGTEPQRRSAAQQLADLYEQARYAPEQESLPTDAIVNARGSLTLLAGMTRA